ncbi:MAG TPA: MFS transporter, partial [Steroidobacteraceae bacterium]
MNPPHSNSAAQARPEVSFGALRHPGFRAYYAVTAVAMTADFIEHVISYWVIFQKFESPELAGFAVISHWLPFLLLSVYSGALADRFDPRRLIQLAMLLFMGVSITWGVLFHTDALQKWHAWVLLIAHGIAGALANPSQQLMLHDIVGRQHLQSAVRLTATARQLGMLAGPGIGSLLLVVVGPVAGIFINALFYVPAIAWLWKAPYGPRFRQEPVAPARAVRGLADIMDAFRAIRTHRTLLAMVLLAGGASFFVGNAYQAQMPEFARDLGHGDPGWTYMMLLGADAAGAVTAGLLLESRALLQPRARTAVVLAMMWCIALGGFALTGVYELALVLLFIAGLMELSFNAMAQTLVQLNAPAEIRGRVIGVFTMSALGMRTFSGITVG